MQTTISRPNHFHNLISLVTFMLIICYYALNGESNDNAINTTFWSENANETNKNIVLETNISHLRAAVLMDADVVQINGLLYAVENSLTNFMNKKKSKAIVQNIHEKLLLDDRKNAIKLINQLPTLPLLK
ncbi:hypothetical protein EMA8858_02041 [Emticicia aquatica]|jgi:hypothetical protein|uniref:DUF4142 domain-containing protein n=1 Tax=Emticicia aquatica TaxID=1681835 RepID=A0ABM9ARJ7_9BACT|nr:hypothetical protein [Emticicia aquatica]CAH0995913.1 hypothetical protein EMA8858_02041 [Emticicia aquatica]